MRPLYHFSLLRDLVVDITPFAAKLRDFGALLTPREEAESYALVSGLSAERSEIDLAIECIGCGRCVSACTMVGHDALARCHGQGNCTEVCPMGLSPADSIRRLRRRAVSRQLGLFR